jgi:transmembrane sensor
VNNIEKYSELIAKYLAGEITPGEERELFAWTEADAANQKFFDETVEIWSLTGGAASTPFEADMTKAWANIEAGIGTSAVPNTQTHKHTNTQTPKSAKIVPLSKIIRRWSVAAAILLLAAAGLWWMNRGVEAPQFVEIRTFDKEKKEIVLPDSSHVWLNENSKLVYDQKFEKRQVTLEGEAFFEVERLVERPFEILSGAATTTVLGTSFNVRAYPAEDKIEVTVKTGKVALAVTKQAEKSVRLEAGESGIFDKKEEKVAVAEAEIANADAWKTDRLDFNEALVKDIIQALERYFDIKIEVSNPMILECHYSANFSQPVISTAMENLAFGLGLDVKKTEDGYLLSGKGCQPDH